MATTYNSVDTNEDQVAPDHHSARIDGKAKDAKKHSLAKKKRVQERGYIKGKKKHTPDERKALANKRRVATGTGGLSRREREVRRVLHEPAVPTRREINTELIRGGIEEEPGPKKKIAQLSSQEKREACRTPLDPAVAQQIRDAYNRPLTKVQFKISKRAEEKEEARDMAAEELAAMGLFDPAIISAARPFRPVPVPGTSHDDRPDSELMPIAPPPSPVEEIPEPPPRRPTHVAVDISETFPAEKVVLPLQTQLRRAAANLNHVVPGGPLPPGFFHAPPQPPPRPPVIKIVDQTFEESDLRGDVLIKNESRDERVLFAQSLFGRRAVVTSATIERYHMVGDCRKVSNRGVRLTDRPFEVRHLRIRVGSPWWVLLLAGLSTLLVAWLLYKVRDVAHSALSSLLLTAYSFALSAALSGLTGPPFFASLASGVLNSLCAEFGGSSLRWVQPFIALAPFFLTPSLLCSHKVVSYMPHLVACLLGEYKRGTSRQVMESTIHQKTNRMATLPLPDRTPNWTANTLEYGSEMVALFLNEQVDFGRAPTARLPGLVDVGAQ